MSWDDESLDYGYVVTRIPDDGWWHLHFGRSTVKYHCELLGRSTNIFAKLQHFGTGVVARSSEFLLTLDGEGVDPAVIDLRLNFKWGLHTADAEQLAQAKHFQEAIMPLLYDSAEMQRGVSAVVQNQQHRRMVADGKLQVG